MKKMTLKQLAMYTILGGLCGWALAMMTACSSVNLPTPVSHGGGVGGDHGSTASAGARGGRSATSGGMGHGNAGGRGGVGAASGGARR